MRFRARAHFGGKTWKGNFLTFKSYMKLGFGFKCAVATAESVVNLIQVEMA